MANDMITWDVNDMVCNYPVNMWISQATREPRYSQRLYSVILQPIILI